MSKRRRPGRPEKPAFPQKRGSLPRLEDELEEAVELLVQQEPPEAMLPLAARPDPEPATGDYEDPALIDPAD
jgi:hypothetical protein